MKDHRMRKEGKTTQQSKEKERGEKIEKKAPV